MVEKLLTFLAPPSLKDEHDNRASILNAILVSAIVGLGIFFLISQIGGLKLVPTTDILIVVLIAVMSVLLLLVRRGQVNAAGVLLLVFGWLALSYQAWITGGLRGTAFVSNVLVILAASLLVGSRTSAVFAGLGIASAWVFALAEYQGIITIYSAPSFLAAFELTVVLVLATVLVNLLIRTLAKALRSARESNRQLQVFSNDLENQVAERTESAELARAEAEAARTAMESRVWLTTRQERLSNCMRGEQDVPTLARNVIRQLCLDLKAQIGTLYLLDNNVLHLKGSYAFKDPEQVSHSFLLGEGLVGQAALEKQSIILTDLPHDYFKVTSSLGQTIPRVVSLHPFLYDEHLVGIIELGTLTQFTPLQQEYLQTATENIAIAFNTAGDRDRINELLQETQAQAKALRSQEEDLRAANKELENQTETLRISESSLRRQQRELETANSQLERTADVLREQQEMLDSQNQALRVTRAELEERAEELEQASRYKSEFLANMSHELRTPLNSLLILAQMLAENEQGNLTPDQVESAQIVFSSGHDLLNLINDILDLSKIEAGKMEFQISPMAFSDLLQAMQQQFGHIAADKGLDFEVEISPHVSPSIQTDQRRIEQVVRNLLSNAFKFTESGSVRLVVERPSADDDLSLIGLEKDEAVVLRVIDSGIGMSPAQQEIVFNGFQQADGSTSRKYGGTGLGLTISRQLVSQLGGQISLESKLDQGSTFSILLPIWQKQKGGQETKGTDYLPPLAGGVSSTDKTSFPVEDEPKTRLTTNPLPIQDDRHQIDPQKRCVLIIEDDVNFARIVSEQAHINGFQFLMAHNGEDGRELAEVKRPDAIVLDLHLPGMSGWDLLHQLKTEAETQHIPVHIISVEDENSDAYRMGAMGFLTKPVSRDELNEVFGNIELSIDHKIRSLLIVEDDANTRKALHQQLESTDLIVTSVATGREALVQLEKESFDCVILDLHLPDMSGFEILKNFTNENSQRKCPIIVYTGKELTATESNELLVYADNIIVKGANSREKLLHETNKFLHRVPPKRRATGLLENPFPANGAALPVNGSPAKDEWAPKHPAASTFPPDAHILAVDDDVRNAFALSKLLSDKALKVSIARSGKKALQLLAEKPDISLVLMDIMMPDMDGYATINEIRKQPRFATLPIIALTARAMTGDAEKCIAAGADDYLSKPIEVKKLFTKIRHWLNRKPANSQLSESNGKIHHET